MGSETIQVISEHLAHPEKPVDPNALIEGIHDWCEVVLPQSGDRIRRRDSNSKDANLSADTFNRACIEAFSDATLIPGEKILLKLFNQAVSERYKKETSGMYKFEAGNMDGTLIINEERGKINFYIFDKTALNESGASAEFYYKDGQINKVYLNVFQRDNQRRRQLTKEWFVGDWRGRGEALAVQE